MIGNTLANNTAAVNFCFAHAVGFPCTTSHIEEFGEITMALQLIRASSMQWRPAASGKQNSRAKYGLYNLMIADRPYPQEALREFRTTD